MKKLFYSSVVVSFLTVVLAIIVYVATLGFFFTGAFGICIGLSAIPGSFYMRLAARRITGIKFNAIHIFTCSLAIPFMFAIVQDILRRFLLETFNMFSAHPTMNGDIKFGIILLITFLLTTTITYFMYWKLVIGSYSKTSK
jgi:hypothetical protein